MQTIKIEKVWFSLLETMSESDIVNSYFGGSNLTANYLNDYSTNAIDSFVGDFLETYGEKVKEYYSFSDLIENPDYILQIAAGEFVAALLQVSEDSEHILRHAKCKFESGGNFYLFALPWSNACCNYYIIRADNEAEAYEILTDEFAEDFAVDEDDIIEGETEINGNGDCVNTENLQIICCIQGV